MLSKTQLLLPVLAGALMLQSCNKKDEFHTSADGLTYKVYEKNAKGAYENKGEVAAGDSTGAKVGQVVTLQMVYKNAADSVLFDSHNQKVPLMIPVMEPSFKGGLENALMMLSAGDSGVFKISADSLFAKTFGGQPMPPFIKKGSQMTFFIKAEKVQSQQEAMADQQKMMQQQMIESQAHAKEQMKIDDQKIEQYIKDNNLQNIQKTESGVYYAVQEEGKGPAANSGDKVKVHYKLSSLAGKEIQNSQNSPQTNNEPFEFTVGQGQVIPAWDEVIPKLKEGSKAVLLVPSPLAYGDQDRGPDMPANSILRFDVELVNVQK
ncbi:FKBP-type peptidyl-prolyl cis-trans isomerase [Pontibacter chitinilyticus]|uniref:FKBP-type peptidyl-prolyl cis-trans isomerase n=1 Tax=Pontibacter chitinilyticus TaxID=2674989 RepID=UPI00321B6354